MSYNLTAGQTRVFSLLSVVYNFCLVTHTLSLGLATGEYGCLDSISHGEKIQSFYSLNVPHNL